jgi:hypothetical protein
MFGFGRERDPKQVYLHVLNDENTKTVRNATDDGNHCSKECRSILEEAAGWMGYQLLDSPWSMSVAIAISVESLNTEKSIHNYALICTPFAVSGLGKLTASGLSRRGHIPKDYRSSNNVGRGGNLWKFRSHIRSNVIDVNLDQDASANSDTTNAKVHITLALGDENADMEVSLREAIQLIREDRGSPLFEIVVRTLDSQYAGILGSFKETLRRFATEEIHFWIADSNNENSTWPALFLPRGASMILLYNEDWHVLKKKGRSKNANNIDPIRQDFDVWNHASHLKTHWLSTKHERKTLVTIILNLIQNEMERLNIVFPKMTEPTATVFGGFKVNQVHSPFHSSSIHCIGENWQWDAYNYRSCHFENLCMDTETRQFVRASTSDGTIQTLLREFDSASTDFFGKEVMRGENIRIGNGKPWIPNHTTTKSYERPVYHLENHVVIVPIKVNQNNNMKNPGHLLWDFWLPLFTLLQMFGKEQTRLLLAHDTHGLQCEQDEAENHCIGKLAVKYLPLLGASRATAFSTEHVDFPTKRVGLLCARSVLAGIGMLTDHGFKTHGQQHEDYETIWNVGRSSLFWDFRCFVLNNVNPVLNRPQKVTFSINSSNNPSRRTDFAKQIVATKKLLPGAVVETIELDKLSLEDQFEAMLETKVFVSVIGGSASSAMFLGRNAGVILFYNDRDDFVNGGEHIMPNMMDFDFWNNAAYLRVHWLPMRTMDSAEDVSILTQLIQDQLFSL